MSVNIKTVFDPTTTITVSDAEYWDLLEQDLVFSVEGGTPIDRPDFTDPQYAEFATKGSDFAKAIAILLADDTAEPLQALATKFVAKALVGAANGTASLGSDLKVPLAQLADSVKTLTGARPVGADEYYTSPMDFPYNAKGDGRTVTDAVLTLNANTVYSQSADFSPADVGKRIIVTPAAGSTRATFAATVTGMAGGVQVDGFYNGVVTDTLSVYSGSNLRSTIASDDTVALRAWLAAPTTRTRLLPGRTFGFTDSLAIRGVSNVQGSGPGSVLAVMAELPTPTTWPAGARTVPTAVYTPHQELNFPNQTVADLYIECNLLADDGFAPKWIRNFNELRIFVRGHRQRGFSHGDVMIGTGDLTNPANRSTSYENKVTDCQTWRDYGVVPRPANSDTWTGAGGLGTVNLTTSGAGPTSVGFYFEYNCTDSSVLGKTVSMGDQVSFRTHAGNTMFIGAHGWSRSSIGVTDVVFDIWSDDVVCQNTYADTPAFGGYWHHGSAGQFYNARVYNNETGPNAQAVGWILTNPNGAHIWAAGCRMRGSAGHTLKADIANVALAYQEIPSSGAFNLQGGWTTDYVDQFHIVADQVIRRPLQKTASYVATAYDNGAVVEMNSAADTTVTIPSGMPIGFQLEVIQIGFGSVTIVAGSGLELPPGRAATTRGIRSRIGARRRQGGDNLMVYGDLAPTHYATSTDFLILGLHNGGTIEYNGTGSGTITLDGSSLPVNGHVDILQNNTGQVSIAVSGGPALVAPDAKYKTRVRYSTIRVRRRAGGDYIISGDSAA